MGDSNQNVKRVFGNYATLDTGAGSIQKQLVYADDTDQLGMHQTDDSMIWYSDDTKQCLLAGAQEITGVKTHTANEIYNDSVKILLGTGSDGEVYHDGTDMYIKNTIIGDMQIDCDSGDMYLNSENLRIEGNAIFTGAGLGLSFGSMYLYEATTTVTIASHNVYTKFTGLTTGSVNNTAFSSSALTVTNVGLYLVQWSVSAYSVIEGNANFTIAVHVNGVTQENTAGRLYDNDDSPVTSGVGIIDVTNAAHEIDLRVRNITDTNDFKYTNMNIVIIQLAGT